MSDMPLFQSGRAMYAASCMTPAWPCISPVPQHGTQQGTPASLSTGYKQSQQNAKRYYVTELHSTHSSPLKATATVYGSQSQGYENITYQVHSQGYGKLLPHIWVRKPDCLGLPYN